MIFFLIGVDGQLHYHIESEQNPHLPYKLGQIHLLTLCEEVFERRIEDGHMLQFFQKLIFKIFVY